MSYFSFKIASFLLLSMPLLPWIVCRLHSVLSTPTMANAMEITLPEVGVKQRLQDPYKMCRLCFQLPGVHDVSKAPILLQAIQQLYNIEVSFQHCIDLCAFCHLIELIAIVNCSIRFDRRIDTQNRCAKDALVRYRNFVCIRNWWKLDNRSFRSASKWSNS